MEFETPDKLIQALSLSNREMACVGDLTKFVREQTKFFKIPFSARTTGIHQRFQTYRCRYGGTKRGLKSSKLDCPCYIKYSLENGVVSLVDANWVHNHPLESYFFEAHFNCLTQSQMIEVQNQQRLGLTPGQIRENLDISVNKDIFYNIRRKAIKESKKESYSDLKKMLANEAEFTSILKKDESGTLQMVIIVNLFVANKNYSDYVITDDTSSTNIYDQPLQALTVVDEEGKTQSLAFGTLINKTTDAYVEFFSEIRNLLKKEIRAFTVDRAIPQISAIEIVFPSSYIIYCWVHIGRDLKKYFSTNDEIIEGWYAIHKNPWLTNKYIDLITNRVNKKDDFPGRNILIELLNTQERWNPIILIENGCFQNQSSNRVEGFFGCFKKEYGFSRVGLIELFKRLIQFSKILIVNSIKSRNYTIHRYSEFPCFKKEDIERIGALALDIISNEYVKFLNHEETADFCFLCMMRNKFPQETLPCRHYMEEFGTNFSLEIIHPRYLRDSSNERINHQIIESSIKTQKSQKALYVDLMAKFSQYSSIAANNEEVHEILNDTIKRLDQLKERFNEGMPPSFTIKGRIAEHPSSNVVFFGKPRERKKYQCGICGEYGHNKASCPNRN